MHLTAENLGVRRGEDFIFMNISFKLSDGEALVLTGRNGSGKSTLLRTVAGLLRPERGQVKIAGEGIEAEMRPSEACHYLGHRNAMKTELTVSENLHFWKDFLGDFHGAAGVAIDEAAESVGLDSIIHLPFGYLSAGQQRRFAMAKLLVAWRPVWILDEPTAALDRAADDMFTDLVKGHLAKGGIVLAATHQPLGLEKAQELQMAGFAGVEAWA
ncbi:heme ABC exporter ATP-binding protein CcmA [Rhizobium pusense]|uniref:Heme ABC transporter (Heme exporter protein A), ATP-binding protein (Cytochrome c-type biogenesis) n=1 Tax=Agrobacterium genomosp. 2 str. CFBP 5494 TaxID=1183436 RepID=A0A9W5AX92_9HYPH|nr:MULTISPECIES: heme ABC exporter ATP-binding protein CcmA [Rhizobium/Agrobacterium group]HCJ70598.1 heme ABC exporter ATP-binding protein CcmA [Agrobacterium sp.]MDH0909998.1 heme ABC exporter ATP-binding protein CcmA [Agrobacterium pusense]MDH1095921.1 heme ABC exporter ATP-binding protein CcmA [Agrobacterium pusense]MDH1112979.1 heme ABC exporter ATP-binding protein CcmA [Agrobacterium pusense]MDH2194781.1 heme ABC exporter ATP-binding protein CcmA [Agrobacterium pusense]